VDCSHYLEQFFPEAARQSFLSRIPLDITLGLDIRGPGGGRWSYCWSCGELTQVRRDLDPSAQVVYRTDTATFTAIVEGRQTPQEAFFAQRIEIEGDMEKALTLATLIESFTREFPYGPHLCQGDAHAAHLCR
jgi:SCP-2 sterol transfer family